MKSSRFLVLVSHLKMIERKTSDHITFGIWDDVSSYLHPPKTNECPLKRGHFKRTCLFSNHSFLEDMLVFGIFFRAPEIFKMEKSSPKMTLFDEHDHKFTSKEIRKSIFPAFEG